MLPSDKTERKAVPLYSGLLKYFPDALAEVAHVSWVGNEQHNPGQDLHWDRSKSTDEADALMRHLMEAGRLDTDGTRHTAKVAWRALALLQKEIEADELNSRRARDQQAAMQNAISNQRTLESQPGRLNSPPASLGGSGTGSFQPWQVHQKG